MTHRLIHEAIQIGFFGLVFLYPIGGLRGVWLDDLKFIATARGWMEVSQCDNSMAVVDAMQKTKETVFASRNEGYNV